MQPDALPLDARPPHAPQPVDAPRLAETAAPALPAPAPVGYRPLLAYSIVASPDDDTSAWIRCGSARANPDGTLLVRLDAFPRNGEVLLRDPKLGHPPPQRLPTPVPPALPRHLDS